MAETIPFGRYVLLEKLAVGGMAELFLAKVTGDAGFEKTCVVKRLLPHLGVDEEFVAMFLDEARLAARLNHPAIVQVFDLGQVQGDYFLAMEYLAGEDLASVLRQSEQQRKPVPIDVAVRTIARAAVALHFAHELQGADGRSLELVHRDVSPSNIFITYQGEVKVLDFGIARAATQLRDTQAGQVKGKAPYMPPEQIAGQRVDRRADVWALGVCLHELLTGVRLFGGRNPREMADAVLKQPIPAPHAVRADVPQRLSEIVLRAVTRDRSSRFQTAEAFRHALESMGPFSSEPPLNLGDYLSTLFGAEQAQVRVRRGTVLTTRLSAPAVGTERLGPAAATVLPTAPVRNRRWLLVALVGLVLPIGAWATLRWVEVQPPPRAPEKQVERSAAPQVPAPVPTVAAGTIAEERPDPAPKASQRVAPRPARLSLDSNLPAVAVLDGRRLGSLPIDRLRVAPGPHRLEVIASGAGATRVERLSIRAGETVSRDIVFRKGTVNVDASPWADVWLDGAPLGQTPLAGREVWEGTHSVRLAGPRGTRTLTVTVRPGKTTVIDERFEP